MSHTLVNAIVTRVNNKHGHEFIIVLNSNIDNTTGLVVHNEFDVLRSEFEQSVYTCNSLIEAIKYVKEDSF